jgi:coenzyme F420-reducing hydrogenase gamma subunit
MLHADSFRIFLPQTIQSAFMIPVVKMFSQAFFLINRHAFFMGAGTGCLLECPRSGLNPIGMIPWP